jgi:stage II sporulation protein D
MESFAHGSGHSLRTNSVRAVVFLILSLAVVYPGGCSHEAAPYTPPPGTPMVRVLLLENQSKAMLSAVAPPVVHVGSRSSVQQLNFPPRTPVPLILTASGWQLGTAQLGQGEILMEPSKDGSVKIGSHAYHGRYRFIPVAADRFNVVNEVNMESYLQGVLRSELFPNWHDEAYKAQAIVARTYALYEARTDGLSRSFDVYPDQRSQAYGGIDAETARSRQATQATSGIVVAYGPPGREVIFKSYFSSCCGGVSQSASDAFGDSETPPLSDQNRGPVCTESPKFNWGPIQIPKAEITRRMRAWGVWKKQPLKDIGNVTLIEIQSTSRYGRPIRFLVTDARGYRYSMRAEDLRESVNTDAGAAGTKIFSSFFKPVDRGADISFSEGHGYGHGVGMCQWCAEHEASQGWNDEAIVLTAFPGAKLVRAY